MHIKTLYFLLFIVYKIFLCLIFQSNEYEKKNMEHHNTHIYHLVNNLNSLPHIQYANFFSLVKTFLFDALISSFQSISERGKSESDKSKCQKEGLMKNEMLCDVNYELLNAINLF